MREPPEPDDLDSPQDVAEFVAACEVTRIDSEMGRVQLDLELEYNDRYRLDFATKRVGRHGDQIHLTDRDTGDTLYRK